MSYRSDLDAAHARIHFLEQENRALVKRDQEAVAVADPEQESTGLVLGGGTVVEYSRAPGRLAERKHDLLRASDAYFGFGDPVPQETETSLVIHTRGLIPTRVRVEEEDGELVLHTRASLARVMVLTYAATPVVALMAAATVKASPLLKDLVKMVLGLFPRHAWPLIVLGGGVVGCFALGRLAMSRFRTMIRTRHRRFHFLWSKRRPAAVLPPAADDSHD